MKIGMLAFLDDDSVDPAGLARKCEALGFESFFLPEHAIIPVNHRVPYPTADGKIPEPYAHFPDPFVGLTMAAAATSTLNVGTCICLVPEHHPLVLAKQVATLDFYSGGRFLFGVGAGWLADESEIMGVDFKNRWPIVREYLSAMKELWSKREASFEGRHLHFPPVKMYPKPRRKPHPPIFIGAGGLGWKCERALGDTVALGDGWMPVVLPPDKLAHHLASLKKQCTEAGRDFSKLEITVLFLQQPELQPHDPKRALKEYAEAGAHRLIFTPTSLKPGAAEQALEELAKNYIAPQRS